MDPYDNMEKKLGRLREGLLQSIEETDVVGTRGAGK